MTATEQLRRRERYSGPVPYDYRTYHLCGDAKEPLHALFVCTGDSNVQPAYYLPTYLPTSLRAGNSEAFGALSLQDGWMHVERRESWGYVVLALRKRLKSMFHSCAPSSGGGSQAFEVAPFKMARCMSSEEGGRYQNSGAPPSRPESESWVARERRSLKPGSQAKLEKALLEWADAVFVDDEFLLTVIWPCIEQISDPDKATKCISTILHNRIPELFKIDHEDSFELMPSLMQLFSGDVTALNADTYWTVLLLFRRLEKISPLELVILRKYLKILCSAISGSGVDARDEAFNQLFSFLLEKSKDADPGLVSRFNLPLIVPTQSVLLMSSTSWTELDLIFFSNTRHLSFLEGQALAGTRKTSHYILAAFWSLRWRPSPSCLSQ